MNEYEVRIREIDEELEEIKTTKTQKLTKRLLKSAPQAAADYYLLKGDKFLNCSRRKTPVPIASQYAEAYRDRVAKLIGDKVPLNVQIAELRQERFGL